MKNIRPSLPLISPFHDGKTTSAQTPFYTLSPTHLPLQQEEEGTKDENEEDDGMDKGDRGGGGWGLIGGELISG